MKLLAWSLALATVSCSTTLFCARGQTAPTQSEQLETAIASVKSADDGNLDVEIIAEAKAVRAIPALEERFGRSTDIDTKSRIASGLVRLGDKNDTYWNLLLEQATLALDSDIPFPSGQTADQFSVAIKAWADAHRISVNTAAESAAYGLPGKVFELAITGDPRGIPLLQRALQSPSPVIVTFATEGLAEIQDKDSIPLIVAACKRRPKFASLFARSLIYFDDPQAQNAVEIYLPKEDAKRWRDQKAQGMKPFGWQRIDPIH